MATVVRLALLVLLLNILRYVIGGAIEMFTIMEPMHAVMPLFPEVFNLNFTATDFAVSLFYNYMLWFSATLGFHLMHPALEGSWLVKSLKAYGVMGLSFISLAAIYMNHFLPAVQVFYLYSIIDAVIVFSIVAVANAVLYPRFFKA